MNMEQAVRSCFNQYIGFQGRARRSEYWYFTLFTTIVSALLQMLKNQTGLQLFGRIEGIWALVIVLPGLAVAIRRLHDIGKSGWWYLLNLIPVIGTLILFIFNCMDSQQGVNRWGYSPKYSNNSFY